MSREIEFRAWDTYQKKMYSWESIGVADDYNNMSLWNLLNNLICHGKNKIIPMQYTGLLDKHGKKIFEGDIVTVKDHDQKIIVGWSEFHASFCLSNNRWLYKHYFGEAFDGDQCEVIGNLCENPDLLEQSK